MEGKIVFEGTTTDGVNYIIRYPKRDDVRGLLEYINTLSREQTFIALQGEQLTLEEEEKFLNGRLEGIAKKKAVMLVVTVANQIVGVSGIDMHKGVGSHVGGLGISVAKEMRGKGIGKKLMELIIKEAVSKIPQLKIVTLSLLANNDVASSLYKKLGFIEYGLLPKGTLRKHTYVDHIFMYKKVR